MSSTPWRVDHSRMGFGSRVWDCEGGLACEVDNALDEPEENQARAEFIVRAVNNHEELLEVARAWERWEAKLILEDNANALEFMSTELYEEMLSLQTLRNDAIEKADEDGK